MSYTRKTNLVAHVKYKVKTSGFYDDEFGYADVDLGTISEVEFDDDGIATEGTFNSSNEIDLDSLIETIKTEIESRITSDSIVENERSNNKSYVAELNNNDKLPHESTSDYFKL